MAALATVMPAMAAYTTEGMGESWGLGGVSMGAYINNGVRDGNTDHYKFYAFFDPTDITTTLPNKTLDEFKTTYGAGFSCTSGGGDHLTFGASGEVVTYTTSNDIWGVVVYENGDNAKFSAAHVSYEDFGDIYFEYKDGNNTYVGFKSDSPVVPEPATATLSLLALAGMVTRRRRK